MSEVVLRAEQVSKSYNGLEVLRGVTFEVDRSEVKVIIGPSGSGKSTLLRCLALLEPVEKGAVYLEGDRVSGLREKTLAAHRSEIGMVFQRFNLFPHMTALQPASVYRESVLYTTLSPCAMCADCRSARRVSVRSSFSRAWGWPTRPTTIPTSCRAGSSSVSRSRARS